MISYQIPEDADEQTRLLIEAGVAEMVLRFLPSQRPKAHGTTLEACKFWARWTLDDGESVIPLRRPWLQVVVRYPSNHENDRFPFYGCAITVADEDGPECLEGDETLSPEQVILVERLAGSRPEPPQRYWAQH